MQPLSVDPIGRPHRSRIIARVVARELCGELLEAPERPVVVGVVPLLMQSAASERCGRARRCRGPRAGCVDRTVIPRVALNNEVDDDGIALDFLAGCRHEAATLKANREPVRAFQYRTGQSVRFASYPILSPRYPALRSGGRRDGTPGDPRDWASSRRTASPTSRPRIGRRR